MSRGAARPGASCPRSFPAFFRTSWVFPWLASCWPQVHDCKLPNGVSRHKKEVATRLCAAQSASHCARALSHWGWDAVASTARARTSNTRVDRMFADTRALPSGRGAVCSNV